MPQRHLIRLNCCPCGERRWIASHCSALKKCTNIYQAITGQSVQPDVLVSVLSMIPGSMKAIKKYILRHMLTAARTVIARKWRKMADPSIEEWVCEMSELQFLYVRSRSKGTNLKDMATMGGVQNLSNFIKLFVEQYYRAFLLCLPSQLLSYSPALPFSPPFFVVDWVGLS